MPKNILVGVAVVILLLVSVGIYFNRAGTTSTTLATPASLGSSPTSITPTKAPVATKKVEPTTAVLVPPIAEFSSRITKKPFGLHVTPQDSPVQPERFSGYHTGTDIEYGDTTGDIPVLAVAEGEVKLARTATGYGGVVAIAHTINGEVVVAVYGHLDPKSLPAVGSHVTAGQQIGILGAGGTSETDGERQHLHFGVHKGNAVDIRGYVQNQPDLAGCYDPVTWLNF